VRALIAQRDGARVGLEGLHDFGGERSGGAHGYGGLGVFAGGGDGEHFGEPKGEGEVCAGFEGLGGVVVEVAEVGDVEFEFAGDFLEVCRVLVGKKVGELAGEEGGMVLTSASVRIASMS